MLHPTSCFYLHLPPLPESSLKPVADLPPSLHVIIPPGIGPLWYQGQGVSWMRNHTYYQRRCIYFDFCCCLSFYSSLLPTPTISYVNLLPISSLFRVTLLPSSGGNWGEEGGGGVIPPPHRLPHKTPGMIAMTPGPPCPHWCQLWWKNKRRRGLHTNTENASLV